MMSGTPKYRIGKQDFQRRLAQAANAFIYASLGSLTHQLQQGVNWYEMDLRTAFGVGLVPFLLSIKDYFTDTQ